MTERRQPSASALQWILIGLTLIWFVGISLLRATSSILTAIALEGTQHRVEILLVTGGLQIGGTLVAIAVGKLVSAWNRLFLTGLTLLFAAAWSMLTGLGQTSLTDHPDWAAAIQLLLGIVFLLAIGGWMISRMQHQGLVKSWAQMGLTRSGSLGWALASAAVVLWPWFLLGSLGDVRESASILFQSAVSGLTVEWLWRGLVLCLLLSVTERRWAAGLLGGLLYAGYEIANLQLGGGELTVWEAITILGLAFLSTELWARPGKGRHGVWGAVVFHLLYLAIPRLFWDSRLDFELSHWAMQLYMPLATSLIALLLFGGRKLRPAAPRPLAVARLQRACLAIALWTAALGLYMLAGRPGFANDGYLIILRNQADLSPAAEIPDREERLAFVHALLVETAERTQEELRQELDEMGLSYRPYYLVNMIRVDGTTRGMNEFTDHPEVAQVIRNPNVRQYALRWNLPYGSVSQTVAGLPWGIDQTETEKVWELGITGQGIVVAGQDTGYDWEHPALQDSYRGWNGEQADHDRHWHDAWDDRAVPFDDGLHGTHTLGTAVGNEVGVAPDAQWIGCRNMRQGLGNPGSYVECMEFFLAPYPLGGDPFRDGDPAMAPHVVNNSWGCPPEEGCLGPEPLHTALEVLEAAGIMMVISAGNEGPTCGTIGFPASEEAVLAVGASSESSAPVPFSSRGPTEDGLVKPEVLAPGVNVFSSIPNRAYALADGTSMAGPHVAGLVALLWSANPDLIGNIDQTKAIITQTAVPVPMESLCPAGQACRCGQDQPGQLPNNLSGFGVIDALAAVEAALKADQR